MNVSESKKTCLKVKHFFARRSGDGTDSERGKMILVYMFAGAAVGLLVTIISALLRGNTILSSLYLLTLDRVKR
ncbi:hypothetical protein, partial [Thioclava sp.]|uniref:hypothetical protein n=1 Tax=Thioclava sp. TaxID=1933450 RepID=UPI003AA83CBA